VELIKYLYHLQYGDNGINVHATRLVCISLLVAITVSCADVVAQYI